MNTNINELTLGELRGEYERSQWALAFALERLGGVLVIPFDAVESNKAASLKRVWYGVDAERQEYTIELRDHSE